MQHSEEKNDLVKKNQKAAVDSIKHIGWDELDKRKYYFFGPTFMIGVRLLIFPPILIKTRLQVQKQSTVYKGTYDAFKKIFRTEGVRGFYKGFATSTMTIFSGQIYITTLEVVRANLPDMSQSNKSLIAGICASLAGQTVTVPIDIISQKQMMFGQQVTEGKKKIRFYTARSIVLEIYKKSGFLGFYKGYLASLLTYTPNSGIWWSAYYSFTQFYGKLRPDGVPDIVIQGLSGPSAAVVSSVLTNPADTIRTRLQMEGGDSTIYSVARKLYEEEGIRALHKGLTARLISSAPTGFLLIVTYELVKNLSVKDEFR